MHISRVRYIPLFLAALVVWLPGPPRARADDPVPTASATSAKPTAPGLDLEDLERARDRLVAAIEGKRGGTLGLAVADLQGQLLVEHRATQALNPASNMKLVTAWSALKILGPQHRYLTALYGRLSPRMATLGLRGDGDPSLERRHLWEMVERLHRSGLREVGDIVVDQSAFSPPETPPAFDAQPGEWAAFRAPVSALSLAGNTFTLEVRPTEDGRAAKVGVVPTGVVRVEGRVTTGAAGSAESVQLSLRVDGDTLVAKVGGSIPADSRTVRVRRRVDDPRRLAGHALAEICRQMGIEVTGEVKVGEVKGRLVSAHRSAPLAALLLPLGKQSDNFYAETIFKSLSGHQGKTPASFARSAELVRRALDAAGLPLAGVEIRNGSGLFEGGRLTPRFVVALLAHGYREPGLGPELLSQLSIAGVDGTLRARMRGLKTTRAVRAKTGTLAAVSALSGYVLGPAGKPKLAFSLLVNGVKGKAVAVRPDLDRFVEALAKSAP